MKRTQSMKLLALPGFDALNARYADVAEVAEVPGSDHLYTDVEQLQKLISAWLL
ncbi:MAG: hypothetical protein O6766_10630 [Gammaproteobacteria bacterium]|nr:hypothetical protein [Gammaproteobacteria bacterium]